MVDLVMVGVVYCCILVTRPADTCFEESASASRDEERSAQRDCCLIAFEHAGFSKTNVYSNTVARLSSRAFDDIVADVIAAQSTPAFCCVFKKL